MSGEIRLTTTDSSAVLSATKECRVGPPLPVF
jgi:hypothetical protein